MHSSAESYVLSLCDDLERQGSGEACAVPSLIVLEFSAARRNKPRLAIACCLIRVAVVYEKKLAIA